MMKSLKICLSFLLLCHVFIDAAVGTFEQVSGSPFATGSEPVSIAFSPKVCRNLFAAVANSVDNTVSVYSVSRKTGFFTPVNGSPFSTGANPSSVAFSPEVCGNVFAAVTNLGNNTVSVYSVNRTTGDFTPVPGSPFSTGSEPISVAFSPKVCGNLFAAVANNLDNTVSVYSVNRKTGDFKPVPGSPFSTGLLPFSVAFSPEVSGNLFAAVTNFGNNTVSVYSVNRKTGDFTSVPGSPFSTSFGPFSVAFSPKASRNLFAAVTNRLDNTVSVYSVNRKTGDFTPVQGSPFSTGMNPLSVAFSPKVSRNLFAAVANGDSNTISIYSVNTTIAPGSFMPVKGSPFSAGSGPFSVAFSPKVLGNLFVAAANIGSNSVSVYQYLPPICKHGRVCKPCKHYNPCHVDQYSGKDDGDG